MGAKVGDPGSIARRSRYRRRSQPSGFKSGRLVRNWSHVAHGSPELFIFVVFQRCTLPIQPSKVREQNSMHPRGFRCFLGRGFGRLLGGGRFSRSSGLGSLRCCGDHFFSLHSGDLLLLRSAGKASGKIEERGRRSVLVRCDCALRWGDTHG